MNLFGGCHAQSFIRGPGWPADLAETSAVPSFELVDARRNRNRTLEACRFMVGFASITNARKLVTPRVSALSHVGFKAYPRSGVVQTGEPGVTMRDALCPSSGRSFRVLAVPRPAKSSERTHFRYSDTELRPHSGVLSNQLEPRP